MSCVFLANSGLSVMVRKVHERRLAVARQIGRLEEFGGWNRHLANHFETVDLEEVEAAAIEEQLASQIAVCLVASIRLATTVCDAARHHTRESWDAKKAEQAPSTLPLPQRSNP